MDNYQHIAIIKFLHLEGETANNIHKHISDVLVIFWQCYATITNLIREFKRGRGGHQRYPLSWTSVDRGNRGNRRKYPPDGVENRKFSIQDIQEKMHYSYEDIIFILH